MKKYPQEFKASIIAKMLPPNNMSIPELARETGVPKDTLYCWRLKHRKSQGEAPVATIGSAASKGLSSEEKFAVVVRCSALNETELSEYCRSRAMSLN